MARSRLGSQKRLPFRRHRMQATRELRQDLAAPCRTNRFENEHVCLPRTAPRRRRETLTSQRGCRRHCPIDKKSPAIVNEPYKQEIRSFQEEIILFGEAVLQGFPAIVTLWRGNHLATNLFTPKSNVSKR